MKRKLLLIMAVIVLNICMPVSSVLAWGQTSVSDRGAVSKMPLGWKDPFRSDNRTYSYKVPEGFLFNEAVQLPNKSKAASYYLSNWGVIPK